MKQEVLGKYSFGVGDRFAQQAAAQIAAIQLAEKRGISITPVWNKSFREHTITGTKPIQTRKAVDAAVRELGWKKSYFIDADHINLDTVDGFMDCSDYFTIDVAETIGQAAAPEEIEQFVAANRKYVGDLKVHDSVRPFPVTEDLLYRIAGEYLCAVEEAGRIYKHIRGVKKEDSIVIEVSMDEADAPQTPPEMLFILAAMAAENIPIRAIAPKFSGRFNKGIDYVGDVDRFRREFEELLAAIRYAVAEFELPEDLKISVHTGSDKFSIYPVIKNAIKKFDAGIHLKTAGTTWLEELAGLAEAGGRGLAMAKQIYSKSHARLDELRSGYAAVIDIDPGKLPPVSVVNRWNGEEFTRALKHEQSCLEYNPNFRQLLHIGFKIAAGMGDEFLNEVKRNERIVSKNVTENLFTRHIARLFLE
jgi:tagaturonate epimerase